MNVVDEVILTISLISLAIGLFGVAIHFGYKIKKLEDTVDNLYFYFTADLEPQIKRIREVVNNEIINKKEDTSINNPDWMYSIFDKDKIMVYKEQWTKEAEEAGMPLTEYLESIKPTPCREDKGMTAEEKQKFKEHMKDYTKAQIIGWMSAMPFILLLDETTKKLRDELFDMLNICIDVIKEEGYDKGCEVKAENDDMEAMLEHLWDDTADEESEVNK